MPLNLLPTRTVLHDRSYGLESRHLRMLAFGFGYVTDRTVLC
jgi:hypothetical protein